MKMRVQIAGVTGAALAVAAAAAAPCPAAVLQNGSFETTTPTTLPDNASATASAPWTFFGAAGVFNPTDAQFAGSTNGNVPAPAQGQNSAFITGGNYFYQNAGTIEAGHTYALSLAVGARLDLAFPDGYEVMLRRDSPTVNTLARSYYGTSPNQAGSQLIPTAPAAGTFQTVSTPSFTATNAADVGHDLYVVVASSGGSGTRQIFADNLVLTDTVPEPTSLAVVGVGAVGLLARRRRARRA